MSKLIGIGELAKAVKLHPNTIRKLADRGEIPSVRTGGGQRRFNLQEVQKALSSRLRRSLTPTNSDTLIDQPGVTWHKEFALGGLSEDLVWKELSQTLALDLSQPCADIFPYAFTEMLNNAIEHSDGSRVTITFLKSETAWSFLISDNGQGAFQSVMTTFQLLKPIEAIAELSKGKRTTAPSGHSGEGIFFTSKAVDLFEIESNGLKWITNNLINDFAVEESALQVGTSVFCHLEINTSRSLISVFARFTENHEFMRSRPTIKLFETGITFLSRSEARRLVVGLEKFAEVVLDFIKVKSVGQGFVDEIFRVWASSHPETKLRSINMNPEVEFMVLRGMPGKPLP